MGGVGWRCWRWALFCGCAWDGRVHAGASRAKSAGVDYASPLEVLLSPDGARLYVLCQQSEEVGCWMRRVTR
jgi:hypothetical protein